MISDSINDEILRIKRELAARFDNDVRRIADDARARQQNAITLPPRPWPPESGEAMVPPGDLPAERMSSPAAG